MAATDGGIDIMLDLNLDFDEDIILETDGVLRDRNGRITFLRKMILTNKNIIYVTSEKSGGIFSKAVDVADKTPLSEIKVINDHVLARQIKRDIFQYILQIQFCGGTEEYTYGDGSKKITKRWIDELNSLIGNNQSQSSSESSNAYQARNPVDSTYGFVPQKQPQKSVNYCENCGTRIAPGANFCTECGFPVGNEAATVTSTKKPETDQCGHQMEDRDDNSVQNLQRQLREIENRSPQAISFDSIVKVFMGIENPEPTLSSKKVKLIRNFPIPNTIEEIADFVILAAGNINVNLSKESFGNNLGRTFREQTVDERSVSDAWIGKLQQAYQKAEIFFPEDPIFEKIKQIYMEKMKELNMSKK